MFKIYNVRCSAIHLQYGELNKYLIDKCFYRVCVRVCVGTWPPRSLTQPFYLFHLALIEAFCVRVYNHHMIKTIFFTP